MQIKEISKLKNEIENILSDNKAIEIRSVDLKDKTSIADFMIVASGNSSRHIQALSEILVDELRKKGIKIQKNQMVFGMPRSVENRIPIVAHEYFLAIGKF